MSALNLGLMLPTTASIIRPFGQTDIQRPMAGLEAPVTPPSSSDRKRKYDWSEHQDAPIRPNLIARPVFGAGILWF